MKSRRVQYLGIVRRKNTRDHRAFDDIKDAEKYVMEECAKGDVVRSYVAMQIVGEP